MTTIQIVMLAIRGIKFLQAMQPSESVEVRNKLIAEALPDASESDVATISREIATIEPDFIKKLLQGIGEGVGKILWKIADYSLKPTISK